MNHDFVCTLAALLTGSGSLSAKDAVDKALAIIAEVEARSKKPEVKE